MKKDKNHITKLDNIEKKEVFQAPDDYFEKLQRQVFDKIESTESKKSQPKRKQLFFNPFWMSVAAAITVLIITFFSLRESVSALDNNKFALLEQVSSEEIIAYLEKSDLSFLELEEALRAEDLRDFQSLDSEDFNSYSEDELDDLYEYYSL